MNNATTGKQVRLNASVWGDALYPHIAFSGFHPDIRAFGHKGKPVPSPTWNHHSGLILAAFADGVPE